MSAVIYCRFSSEMQRDESLADQERLCREYAARERLTVTRVYADRAVSGTTTFRPQYQAMLADAQKGGFTIVVAESLDRLSRDQGDIAHLYKELCFRGIRIVTVAEGEINELHVGLKGTMNALFIKDLALKTHRGLRGRAEAGKSAGGLSYGYRAVRVLLPNGELSRGDRTIEPAEADVVRRIFNMFTEGHSPIAIARALNAENIPGPDGRAWRDTTIRGHALRGTGILHNRLYVGEQVWNRMHFAKDPATGKRVSRMNPTSAWVITQVPELRIVDDTTWTTVQTRLNNIRAASGADNPDRPTFWKARRAQGLLTGKVFCGCCGGPFSLLGPDYLACSAARRQGTCRNRGSIHRSRLEALALEGLRNRLMQPDAVSAFISDFTDAWNRLAAERVAASTTHQRELATIERKIDVLLESVMNGGLQGRSVQHKLDALEQRKAELQPDAVPPRPPLPCIPISLPSTGCCLRLPLKLRVSPAVATWRL